MGFNPRLFCIVPKIMEAPPIMRRMPAMLTLLCWVALGFAQPQSGPTTKDFIKVPGGVIALEHLRVIDGTGAPVKNDHTILISDGKITALGPSGSVQIPANARRL